MPDRQESVFPNKRAAAPTPAKRPMGILLAVTLFVLKKAAMLNMIPIIEEHMGNKLSEIRFLSNHPLIKGMLPKTANARAKGNRNPANFS